LASDQLHDPHAAVYAALILVEAGQLDAAKRDIATAETGKLYPEERKLIEEAKTSFAAASATGSEADQETPPSLKPMR
jgi:hypothetical protein